ncbi:PEPxxWA-CTERM sorting domain-containing protein [Polymorphobacter fuscus]|uniref:PEPxxWA-CTERM sorting domain-containing protein n=1 Tax=Sandarakinorhabdus fusca TaxID=1439888 RepID=UPI0016A39726|nr:PEPxxWA-CTERM sorting domain-containing protein [Polymorphobacter fuscus]NJC09655.1 hypothetical protein [Polymorphobacter fuscus]
MLATTAGAASAAVVTATGYQSFESAPYTYDFGGGNSVTFEVVGGFFEPAGVATTGNVQVLSDGAPFFDPPRPAAFFTNRGGSIGPNSLGVYAGYASPAVIPFSISRGIIGLRFDLGQGFQYGIADLAGGNLYGIRFNTDPGASIRIAAVPEPASWAMMIVGFGLSGAAMRRRRDTGLRARRLSAA